MIAPSEQTSNQRHSRQPASKPVSRQPSAPKSTSNGEIRCNCDVSAAQRTVVKESISKGKKFWTCGTNNSCGFFQWVEEIAGAQAVVPTKRSYSTVLTPQFPMDPMINSVMCHRDKDRKTLTGNASAIQRLFPGQSLRKARTKERHSGFARNLKILNAVFSSGTRSHLHSRGRSQEGRESGEEISVQLLANVSRSPFRSISG